MTKKTKTKSIKRPGPEKVDATSREALQWFDEGRTFCETYWPRIPDDVAIPYSKVEDKLAHFWWSRGYAYSDRLLRAASAEMALKIAQTQQAQQAQQTQAQSMAAPIGKSGAILSGPQTLRCPNCTGDLDATFGLKADKAVVVLGCQGSCKSGFELTLKGIVPAKDDDAETKPPEPPKPHRDPNAPRVKLTEEEVDYLSTNTVAGCPACPDCKIGPLSAGPSGGGSINMLCLNGSCGSQFNDTGAFGWERLTPPSPLKGN